MYLKMWCRKLKICEERKMCSWNFVDRISTFMEKISKVRVKPVRGTDENGIVL